MPCIYCYDFFVFTVSSTPLNLRYTTLLPPTTPLLRTTTSSTTVPLPSSFQASSAPSLSLISPFCLYYSVALGICRCYVTILFNCIACHCRHLLYLSDILCCLKYILYTTMNP